MVLLHSANKGWIAARAAHWLLNAQKSISKNLGSLKERCDVSIIFTSSSKEFASGYERLGELWSSCGFKFEDENKYNDLSVLLL